MDGGQGKQPRTEATKVVIRVRPALGDDDKCSVEAAPGSSTVKISREGKPTAAFVFDNVACKDTTQEELFAVCSEYVESALMGINVAIMAYGQTGTLAEATSGSTHAGGRLWKNTHNAWRQLAGGL
jgi:hypothetical protein